MRPSNKSRSRNKPGNNGNNGNHNNNNNGNRPRSSMGNIINRVFESAGPDGKVRGTPQQIIDKYQALARDAQLAGDRVTAESYLQHSEHYSRLLGEAQRQQMENNRFNEQREEGQRGFNEQREDGQRFGQEREDGQRGFNQDREDGQRSFGQEREDAPRGGEDGGFERRQPQSQPVAVDSGLTTIDADDSYDMAGPIETPEGRRSPLDGPAPVVVVPRAPQPEPAPVAAAANGAEHPVPASEAAPEAAAGTAEAPVKRSRPRRRQKAEVPAAEPVQQAE